MFGFSSFASAPFAFPGTESVAVAVTGLSASGALGTGTVVAKANTTLIGV